jgi:curved DNA-binding protein CbpA
MRDFYEVLQVHPRAEAEVIRAAYRTLARKYHPDHGGDALRMIALNDAWDVLGDPDRRAAYDATRTGAGSRTASTSRPPAAATPAGSGSRTASTSRPPAAATPAGSGGQPETGAPRQTEAAHAGPPPGHPSGTVLDFGRYAGWSLGEIARHDAVYLEWLQRATFGRKLRAEIDALLRQRAPAAGRPPSGSAWNRRR